MYKLLVILFVIKLYACNSILNNNNIIFTIKKTQNYMFLSLLYQQKITKNYQNILAKDLKDHFIEMNIKQKMRIKIHQVNTDIFLNQILLELIDYLL